MKKYLQGLLTHRKKSSRLFIKVMSFVKFFSLNFKAASLLCVCAALSGCSFAPGISFSEAGNSQETSGGIWLPQWLRALDPSTKPGSGLHPGSKTPPTVVLPITPDLIRMQRSQQAVDMGQDVKRLFGAAKPYSIGPGDVVNVVVWDHPQLNLPPATTGAGADVTGMSAVGNGYNVSSEGSIQFPYVGRIVLSGLTEDQARQLLTEKLSKFLKSPDITLRILAYRSARIYIEGEVKTPGGLSINDVALTLPEAIARAGGFLPAADRAAVTIVRGSATTVINLPQMSRMGINPGQILLGSGDIVQVASREDSKVYVLGEVARPSVVPLRNGRITLGEALGESGGVSQMSGDARQVFVLRRASSGVAEVYHLDASKSSAYVLADSFDLKPRDVVFVDPSPLVRVNRVISLLIPGAALANTSADVVRR